MMAVRFQTGFIAACAMASLAYAEPSLQIPKLGPFPNQFIKMNFSAATRVENGSFSIQAPRGWSVAGEGVNDRFDDNILITATPDTARARTFAGVHVFVAPPPPGYTLEQKYTKEEKRLRSGEKLGYATWEGRRWLVKEYNCQMPDYDAKCWAAWTYENGMAALFNASTPVYSLPSFREPLMTMMHSVRFTPSSKR